MSNKQKTKVCLITGASSGIGLELAKIAAADGLNLLLISQNKERLNIAQKEVSAYISSQNQIIDNLVVDLSLSDSGQMVWQYVKKQNYSVETLVNNAGFGDYGQFAESDLNKQLSMIDLNVRSLTELTHRFLPDIIDNNGRVMNVGSIASFLPGPLMSVYFATKNYVLAFSEALAEELKDTGASVTCLCPGATKTNFGKTAHVSQNHSTANPKVTAKQVAEFGWKSMQKRDVVAVYGMSNRLMLDAVRLLPRKLVRKLVYRIQK